MVGVESVSEEELGKSRALRGASPISIKVLAGHTDLATTQRCSHLSPAI
jgi:hypothetical protein